MESVVEPKPVVPERPALGLPFMGPWCSVQHAGNVARVSIRNEIGTDCFTAADFLKQIGDAGSVELQINSHGGCLPTAFKIHDGLVGRTSRATINEYCCSAAVVVALAARQIRMEASARMMLHPACDWTAGNSTELRFRADVLDRLTERQIKLVGRRTDRAQEFLSGPDHWLSAEQALACGLADEIFTAPADVNACAPAGEAARREEAGPTEDEWLVNDFLRAFGQVSVRDRQQFARNMTAWAVHNSVQI